MQSWLQHCAQQLSFAFCSGVYFPYCPLFLLLFESIAERTSELEDAIDVDGQLLANSFHLEVQKERVLGAEATKWHLTGAVSCMALNLS